jgi:hypothetical protein
MHCNSDPAGRTAEIPLLAVFIATPGKEATPLYASRYPRIAEATTTGRGVSLVPIAAGASFVAI